MKNIVGDLFKPEVPCDAICITTNGFVKKNGECVMGKGCALQAKQFLPSLPKTLGDSIKLVGNVVSLLRSKTGKAALISFPVKPVSIANATKDDLVSHKQLQMVGTTAPGWACVADIRIIEQSARELLSMANTMGLENVIIPRPGCGAGELSWDVVEPILQEILDDRFSCITFA